MVPQSTAGQGSKFLCQWNIQMIGSFCRPEFDFVQQVPSKMNIAQGIDSFEFRGWVGPVFCLLVLLFVHPVVCPDHCH
eukprot:981748-Ditylum_brightwellii.AAC.1